MLISEKKLTVIESGSLADAYWGLALVWLIYLALIWVHFM